MIKREIRRYQSYKSTAISGGSGGKAGANGYPREIIFAGDDVQPFLSIYHTLFSPSSFCCLFFFLTQFFLFVCLRLICIAFATARPRMHTVKCVLCEAPSMSPCLLTQVDMNQVDLKLELELSQQFSLCNSTA